MSREQTEERLRLAIEKVKEAYRLNMEGRKIIEELGGWMCINPYTDQSYCHETDACERLQMYEGIKTLAEELGVELRRPHNLFGDEIENELGFVFDGVLFFQLGNERADGNYTFR